MSDMLHITLTIKSNSVAQWYVGLLSILIHPQVDVMELLTNLTLLQCSHVNCEALYMWEVWVLPDRQTGTNVHAATGTWTT